MDRRKLIQDLTRAGFINRGGGNHDVYVRGNVHTVVPRHGEISESLAMAFYRQAGLDYPGRHRKEGQP